MEDGFDPDVDFDDKPIWQVTKKRPLWLIVGAFFELISNILKAFTGFLDIASDASLQRFTWRNERERFMQQAAREIETLTSGDYDASTFSTGRSVGSGAAESAD